MRLWSLHPKYLDARGLGALWREGLLAQKVLRGGTKGYRHHPQLARFRTHPDPVAAIAEYLRSVLAESRLRGYRFNGRKISRKHTVCRIPCTRGQLLFEWAHLREKLRSRDPDRYRYAGTIVRPDPHPLFVLRRGGREMWEKAPAEETGTRHRKKPRANKRP